MRKLIKVKKEKIPMMGKELGVSRTTVYDALAFRSYSTTAELIRKKAIEVYGGIMTKAL